MYAFKESSSKPSTTRRSTITPASLVNYEKTIQEEGKDESNDESHRRSFCYHLVNNMEDQKRQDILDKVDEVERMITLSLQNIDKNLNRCGKTLTERTIPALENYNKNCTQVLLNVNHLKEFFENAINTTILTGSARISSKPEHMLENSNEYSHSFGEGSEGTESNFSNLDTSNISNPLILNTPTRSRRSDFELDQPRVKASSNVSYSEFPEEIERLVNDSNRTESCHTVKTQFKESELNINTDQASESSLKRHNIDHKQHDTPRTPKTNNCTFSKVVKKYESPPWEEPPELESEKLVLPAYKKRHTTLSNPSLGEETNHPQTPNFKLDFSRARKGTKIDEPHNIGGISSTAKKTHWDSSSSTFEEPPEITGMINGPDGKSNTVGNKENTDEAHGRAFSLDDAEKDEFQSPPSLLTERLDHEAEKKTDLLDSF